MASAKETCEIIDATPINQPIMLEGIHGIGKSEVVSEYFSKKGYRIIVLFLGQMADAGDIIGLPNKVEKNGIVYTDYAPPLWWPKDTDEKILLFLDELNRARPEIHQVIMDLCLNRRLAGKDLPKNTRIVAAVNPSNNGSYQVEDLDPALLDRFNKVDFRPTFDEWVDWALSRKVHNKVIGFLSKNTSLLDPPSRKEAINGSVYPSRRSWKRVSDVLNNNSDLNEHTISNVVFSIVGAAATATFMQFWRENKQIHVGTLLLNYQKVKKDIKEMNIQDLAVVNREMCNWFEENESHFDKLGGQFSEVACKISNNLLNYVEDVPGEIMAELIEQFMRHRENKKTWPEKLLLCNPEIKRRIMEVQSGNKRKS
jgi:hypothetical protein